MFVSIEDEIKMLEKTYNPLYKAMVERKVEGKYIPEGFFEMNEFLNKLVCRNIEFEKFRLSFSLVLDDKVVGNMIVSYLNENINDNLELFTMRCRNMKIKDFVDLELIDSYDSILKLINNFKNLESPFSCVLKNYYYVYIKFHKNM